MIKIAFDIGGVLSKYPDLFFELMRSLATCPGIEVHVMTDATRERADALIRANNIPVEESRIHACDSLVRKYGDRAKAVKCKELGIDILIDDHDPYISQPDGAKVRLKVMPDDLPFYHETFKH